MSENETALLIFRDHPIAGVGWGSYGTYYPQYSLLLGQPIGTTRAAHNLFLEIAAETGLLGIVAFGMLLFALYRSIRDSYRRLHRLRYLDGAAMIEALGIGLIGYLSASMFLHSAYIRSFWLLAGIALALPQIVRNETSKQVQS